MEELLTPQICMDVEETPLEVGKDDDLNDGSSDTTEPDFDDDEKVKRLLEIEFTDPSQVPEQLTDFEIDAKRNVFSVSEPAVQYHRLHCTACNVHLGSAPIGHFNRFIHPLLKVLLCKQCYEFYCSGEFDKDEDGSEMYCRWCGQGGKVMCCAQCAYVFCQKCVRQNLGKKTLEIIKDSDDWMCFACNPTQLINLKIVCTSLYDFVQEEIRLARALNSVERLKLDHSVCCQKSKSKRKRDEDTVYNPSLDWDEQVKSAKKSVLKQTLMQPKLSVTPKPKTWGLQDGEDEVVCTPDLPSLMEDDDKTPQLSALKVPPLVHLSQTKGAIYTNTKATGSKYIGPRIAAPLQKAQKFYPLAPKPPILICTTNNRPILPSNIQKANNSFVRLQTPAVKFTSSINNRPLAPIVNSTPAHIVPGSKHEWFEKAASVVSTITGNLSTTLVFLTRDQSAAKTVEQLATVHNQLQELLSTSVNSLIQVRKNLRTEFLADLNKLRFTDRPNLFINNTFNKNVQIVNPKSNKDDDDVILVNSEKSSSKVNEKVTVNQQNDVIVPKRTYLKVRSVSQLHSVPSECITIPDDPSDDKSKVDDDDVVPVEEKDPLSLDFELENDPLQTTELKDTNEEKQTDITINNFDERTHLLIKNALMESSIDQIVQENLKYSVEDMSLEELKRVLSVRVLLATNYSSYLPKHRLKTSDCFIQENTSPAITENIEMDVENLTEDNEGKSANEDNTENINESKDDEKELNCPEVICSETDDKEVICSENEEKDKDVNCSVSGDNKNGESDCEEEMSVEDENSSEFTTKSQNNEQSNEEKTEEATKNQNNEQSSEEKTEDVETPIANDDSCKLVKQNRSESENVKTSTNEEEKSSEIHGDNSEMIDDKLDDSVDLPIDKVATDTENNLTSDFSTDLITTDSGIDVDSK